MDNPAEVREFLVTRRARLTPEQAGIIGGGRRRVAGLRREEVAMLAGMSTDYYARMERGNLAGVSPEVLEALARALQLDEAEIAHLHDLARAATPVNPIRKRSRAAEATVRPPLQRLLDAISVPAYLANVRKDFLATNTLGAAVFAPILDDPSNGRNNARFTFLTRHPESSTRTGSREPPASSLPSGSRRERTLTTRRSPTSSGSSSPAATRSAPSGRNTTSIPPERNQTHPSPCGRRSRIRLRGNGGAEQSGVGDVRVHS